MALVIECDAFPNAFFDILVDDLQSPAKVAEHSAGTKVVGLKRGDGVRYPAGKSDLAVRDKERHPHGGNQRVSARCLE